MRLASKSCAGVAGLCDGVVAFFSACDRFSTLLSLSMVINCHAFAVQLYMCCCASFT